MEYSLWSPTHLARYPVVVYFHGVGSNRVEGRNKCALLMPQGIGVCAFDWSGSGNSKAKGVTLGWYESQDA